MANGQSKQKKTKTQRKWAVNTLPLVFDENCEILILGSFPAEDSRKHGFYYCNPNNLFWNVLEEKYRDTVPWCICSRRDYLLRHHIALWDVCSCCSIIDSKDSTIKEPVYNRLCCVLKKSRIKKVLCNGSKAYELFNDMCKQNGITCPQGFVEQMPSSSGIRPGWKKSDLKNCANYSIWGNALK